MNDTSATGIELGIDTFGDVTRDGEGNKLSHAQVIRNVLLQGQLADRVGLDFIGIGEHHRPDFAVSSPDTILAALASTTERIKLGSAVTVLSSDDPIRVYQRFATINALSNGRAEAVLGRGSFTESFPLFGYSLQNYEKLFAEKFDIFKQIVAGGQITAERFGLEPLATKAVYPNTEEPLRHWLAVGGSPESIARAVNTATPLMLAIIGGQPARFKPFVDAYRAGNEQLGNGSLPVAVHSPGHIADSDEQARDEIREHWLRARNRIGKERGWGAATEREFDTEIEHGSLYVGSPETVAQKIAATAKTLGLKRFDLKYATGQMPHETLLGSIELYGTKVAPRVREILAADSAQEV
ncbi:LLM class flavin-dependent oxidoreductase [Leucobacter sp. OH2974_COT-288]|nr:LLM class flavin-dependent oxidoreductase [Leucobacter sp. OH2974_COT-288]